MSFPQGVDLGMGQSECGSGEVRFGMRWTNVRGEQHRDEPRATIAPVMPQTRSGRQLAPRSPIIKQEIQNL